MRAMSEGRSPALPADNPPAVEAYFRDLVAGFVRGDVSVSDAAAGIAEPVEAAFGPGGAAEGVLADLLWTAWECVVHAAAEADEPTAGRLVALLVEVRDRGVLTRGDGHEELRVWQRPERAWSDLPLLGALMREAWNWGSPPDSTVRTWVNLNTFAARLTSAGIDYSTYFIWALRASLEEPGSGGSEQLEAAVPWFRFAGPPLRVACQAGAGSDAAPLRLGALAVQSGLSVGGFTMQRWHFWRDRLRTLASGADPAADTARAALRFMETGAAA